MAKVTHRQGKWEERRPHLPPPDRGSGGKPTPPPPGFFLKRRSLWFPGERNCTPQRRVWGLMPCGRVHQGKPLGRPQHCRLRLAPYCACMLFCYHQRFSGAQALSLPESHSVPLQPFRMVLFLQDSGEGPERLSIPPIVTQPLRGRWLPGPSLNHRAVSYTHYRNYLKQASLQGLFLAQAPLAGQG